MRVFFGLELPADSAMRIADWRDRQFSCSGRPVPPANFHITLAFVGEIALPALERLGQAVDDWMIQTATPGAQLLLDRTGYWSKPRIYWLGPDTWPGALSSLASKLQRLSVSAGARRDRHPFQPHVTLFRNCTTAPPAPASSLALPLSYQHFTLYESRPGRTGVRYHPLQHWELAPPAPETPGLR